MPSFDFRRPRSRLPFRVMFYLIILATSIWPLTVYALWPHSRSLELEFGEVSQRHLLIARNLGAALERYQRDLVATFDYISNRLAVGADTGDLSSILRNLRFQYICVVDSVTGKVIASSTALAARVPSGHPPELLRELRARSKPDQIQFSGVLTENGSQPRMLVFKREARRLLIGSFDTQYFVELAKSISFGSKGHAAIVDQSGRVVAHPSSAWMASAKNITGLSAVARMVKGETGVDSFYSPALKDDMIAGFTSVKSTGWGVMIPQPVNELREKSGNIRQYGLAVLSVGVLIALALAWLFTRPIVLPLQQLSSAVPGLGHGKFGIRKVVSHSFVPQEIHNLIEVFNNTHEDLCRQKADVVSRTSQLRREITNRRLAEARIRHVALHDDLTELPNRRYLTEELASMLDEMGADVGMVVHCLDLDGFKAVNDTLGHAAGDELLRQVAGRLSQTLRSNDFLARLGGDEFAIIQVTSNDDAPADRLARRVVEALSEPYRIEGQSVRCSVCVGYAFLDPEVENGSALLAQADAALYKAKAEGLGSVSKFNERLRQSVNLRRSAKQELLLAFHNDEIDIWFQPQVSLRDKKIIGVEALARWGHPERGILDASEFLQMVNEIGLVVELGNRVIAKAFRAATMIQVCAGRTIPIAINLGEAQLRHQLLTAVIAERLAEHQLRPNALELEITEDVIFRDLGQAREALMDLKRTGVSIALDDFGTGYSSFASLRQFPIDRLKIDRSLVSELPHVKEAVGISRAIIRMAKELNIAVLAEGIETPEQLAYLIDEGIEEGQGFLFSKAIPLKDLIQLLNNDGFGQ